VTGRASALGGFPWRHYLLPGITILVFVFLYAPIVSLVVFSFNENRLVTVWSGFSLKWYASLLQDRQILNAARVSLEVAGLSASLAVVLGTLAGIALARFGPFRGRLLLTGMVTAPLVMPEVITGLSLLLLFVSMEQLIGWPAGRSVTTITIAHATFAMAYVAVIVQSRVVDLQSDIEDAAADLGARPMQVFFWITLPMIAPALVSGWLLAFTLSLDDLVVASFTAGPGSSTLPMVIFSKIRLGVSPDVNALASILIFLVGIGVGIAAWQMRRAAANRARRADEAAQQLRDGRDS